jgi:hypothetical protein
MRSPLVVRRVEIRRSPGFDRNRFPVVDHLEPGLNIVWGPNCVGKTTLAEAMRELLWSTRAKTRIEADALVELEGESFRLDREGGTLRQIRLADGFISEGRWGGQEESERYFFQLHELLRADARGQRFDEFVRDKIRDGVNLDRANEALGASRALTSSAALNAHKLAEEQLRKVKEAQDGQLEIREEIRAAAERLDQARRAGDELQALRRVEALKGAADQVRAAREALAGFPAGIDRLMPDDPRRIEELDRRAEDLARQRREHGRELEALEAERTALAVPAGLLGSDQLAGQIQRLCQAIPEREAQRQAADLKQDQAADAVRLWRGQYSWLAADPPGEAGLEDIVRTLRDLARDCEPIRCQLAAARMRVEDLGEAQPEPAFDSVEHWTRLQLLLGQWQEHASRIVAGEPPLPAWRRHLAAGSALAWVAAALVLGRQLGGAWAGMALLAFLPIYASLNLGRPRTGPESDQAEARATADREAAVKLLAQHPALIPDPWTPAEVLGLLAESARRIGQARQREACNQRLRAATSRHDDARRAYEQWLGKWSEASRQLGLNEGVPALEGAQFFHFAEGLGDWVKAVQVRREADRAAEQAAILLDQDRARLQEHLAAGGEPVVAGPEDRVDQARDLLARRTQALDLEKRIASLRKLLDQDLAVELAAAAQRIQEFWERCGYPQPDPARLQAETARVEAYRAALSTLQARAEAERKLREATAPAELERADGWVWEDLRAALQRVGEQAGQLEALTREHSRLSEQYRQLLDGDALAKALSEAARTKVLRDQELQENAVARTVSLLVQELKAQDLREEQPPVLNRASDWLMRFTRNQFSIGFDLERGYFAHDQAENKLIHLDELSSGTRVQLLFAIRLAFIEEEETPPLTMPLFLDEVLANSDDFRAQDIIQAILEIARDRQVFYFTAQVDEVDKLKLLAGEGNYHEVRLADLQGDRFQSANPLVPVRLATPVVAEPIPDYDAYGQLCDATGVRPGIFEPIEALHAWHLFTRSEDLHRALVRGFVRVGQVLADPVLTDEPVRRSVALLRRAQDLARPGRGRPFRVEDLQDPIFTRNRTAGYWEPLLEEARNANGDGFAFRTRLESVKNLRIRDQIGAWLAENCFTCPGEALGVEAILEQVHRENPWLTVASREREVLERFLRGVLNFP